MIEPTSSDLRHLGRVLVVDDELELMKILCEMLAEHQYEAVGCSSGQAALDVIKDQEIDVLLTDLMMPEMDGIRLLQAAQEVDPYLVGVIMTGQGTVSTAVEAIKTGAFDYLLKPFRMDTVLPVLSRAMSVRRLRMENVRLQETVAIYELSKTVSYVLDVNAILEKLADAALQQCQGDEASVMIPTHEGTELYVAAVRGEGRDRILGQRVPFDRGVAGWVAQHGEAVTLRGAGQDDRFAPVAPRGDLQWAISMPMLVGGKLSGVLNVSSKQRRGFTLGQAKGLSILATAAAGALEHARLYAAARAEEQRYRSLAERLSAVAGFAREVSSTLELNQLFDIALHQLATLTACSWCNVSEYHREEDLFWIAATSRREDTGELPVGATLSAKDSSSGIVLRTGLPYVAQDTDQLSRPSERARSLAGQAVQSRISVPIAIAGEFWGTLSVGYGQTGAATPERVEFLEAMAAHLAVAIHNAQLYSQVLAAHQEVSVLNESLEKRVEERTRELEAASEVITRERARLSATVASMTDGLIVTDSASRIVLCNERGAELLGTTVATLEGKTVEEAVAALQESLADPARTLSDWMEASRSPGERATFELTIDGSKKRDLVGHAFAVTEPTRGTWVGGILLRDVSAEREVERVKDELVGVVSHELRTPLASLVGFADLLLTRDYDEGRRRQFLTVIRQEGNRLTALINDFLDLQRLESGRAMLSPTSTDLSSLLERARSGAAADAQPRILVDLPDNLPLVRADPDALHQVLTNLVSNALKYSPDGGEVRITAKPTDHSLQVSITDHGLGIPADALPRVFDKFYRVDNSDRREIKGTGLGLAICRQLVAAHGGQIWAESDGLGSGTKIHFTLPFADRPQEAGEVLIVDDDPGFAQLIAEEIAPLGLTSRVAPSVEAAIGHIAAASPRAIVLDLLFPNRQGESLLKQLAADNDAHIPVVVVTVKDLDDRQQAELRSLGAHAILRKGPRVATDAAHAVAAALAETP